MLCHAQDCRIIWKMLLARLKRVGSSRMHGRVGKQNSATGTRTQVALVRAEYPNQLQFQNIGIAMQRLVCWSTGADFMFFFPRWQLTLHLRSARDEKSNKARCPHASRVHRRPTHPSSDGNDEVHSNVPQDLRLAALFAHGSRCTLQRAHPDLNQGISSCNV